MSSKGERSVLVDDAEEDAWQMREEFEVPLPDPSRYSAEWIFDAREEAEQMLQSALEAEGATPDERGPDPQRSGNVGANR